MELFGRKFGLPGAEREAGMAPELAGALLGADPSVPRETLHRIGEKEIARAVEILTRYKQGKANLEQRIVEDELWWELRHWEVIRGKRRKEGSTQPEPSSAWLFNAILNKHADAMDNYPEPVVLPREPGDEDSAKVLSSVLPVLMEYNDFEQTYSDNWWEKLKHGTAAYGVFWNNQKENGLGDVDIRQLDLLKLFWEPGVTDIQKSRNLFIVELVDEDVLDRQYPEHAGQMGGNVIDVKEYIYDDTVDTQGKSLVVDWYYKTTSPSGRTMLHYAKFVGKTLLYASENDPALRDSGWYADGRYPVVLDVLFPEKGTPVGFGYVAICKDPQLYIDKLSANILENSMMGTRKRFFASTSTNINREQFLDWSEPIVDVEGELSDARLQEITVRPLDGIYTNVLRMKIEEMKDTAANRDVNSGSTGSGVTAAAAIAALQEAGNKASRDMIGASYRAYVAINAMVIDRIGQFYDQSRTFRITGAATGEYRFVDVNGKGLGEQVVGTAADGVTPLMRKPVFDLKIRAQKKNPFSRMEQNERAKELYGMGFFNPERAQEAAGALEMMEFEGIDKVREQVRQGQTLLNVCRQLKEQMEQLMRMAEEGSANADGLERGRAQGRKRPGDQPESEGSRMSVLTGPKPDSPAVGDEGAIRMGRTPCGYSPGSGLVQPVGTGRSAGSVSRAVMQSQTPMTSYGQRLAKRSTPSLE